jgi:integrase
MATKSKPIKQRRVFFTLDDGMQQVICVPKDVDNATYKQFQKDVKLLVRWVRFGTEIMTRDWNRINNLPTALLKVLADKGLIPSKQTWKLADWLETHLNEHPKLAKRTKMKYATSVKSLVAYFGDIFLTDVTHEKAALYRVHLVDSGLELATVSKMIGVARLFFREACLRKLIDDNPFQRVETGSQVNKKRDYLVSKEEYDSLITACTPAYEAACAKPKHKGLIYTLGVIRARLVIALGQAGLRIPSELVGLRRSEVDLKKNCFVVYSPKTERKGKSQRTVPIFDLDEPYIKLRQYLLDAINEMPEGEDRVFPEIHPETSMQKFINDLAVHAGIKLWPKPFQNMRSTCATVLLEVVDRYVVNDWLGHTDKVADKHYRQVTSNHFDKVTGKSTPAEIVPSTMSEKISASNVCGQLCGDLDLFDIYSRSEEILVSQMIQRMNNATKAAFRDEYGDEPSLHNLNEFYLNSGDRKYYVTPYKFVGDWDAYVSHCARIGITPREFKYKYLDSSAETEKYSRGGT